MAVLTPQTIGGALVPTYVQTIVGGDSFDNNGHVILLWKNTSAGTLTILFDSPAVDNFGISGAVLDITESILAAAGNAGAAPKITGPYATNRYNDANGRVQMTYPGGITGLFVALILV